MQVTHRDRHSYAQFFTGIYFIHSSYFSQLLPRCLAYESF